MLCPPNMCARFSRAGVPRVGDGGGKQMDLLLGSSFCQSLCLSFWLAVDTCTASVYGCLLDVFPTFLRESGLWILKLMMTSVASPEENKNLYSSGEMTSGAVSILSPYAWFDSGFNFMRQFTEAGRAPPPTHPPTHHHHHHHKAQTGCALLFCVGNRCAWLILAGDHLRVVSPSDAESGGCVRGIVTNSRPSAWPLPRSRTTQLYGDRRRQGPGRRGTRSTTRYDDRSPSSPAGALQSRRRARREPASISV